MKSDLETKRVQRHELPISEIEKRKAENFSATQLDKMDKQVL
jgi:hypothetical protein